MHTLFNCSRLMAGVFAALFAVLCTNHASAERALDAQLWDHNGSLMRFVMSPAGPITIVYQEPRAGISRTVQPGDILVTGTRNGDEVYGQAFVFKRGCQPVAYPVRGGFQTIDDRQVLTLRGAAPQRRGCRVVGYSARSSNAVLVFTAESFANFDTATPLTAVDGNGVACDTLATGVRTLEAVSRVRIAPSQRVGEPIRIAWQSRRPSQPMATYLVVTASRPVRIAPTSSAYALLPAARAPYDLKIGADQTRVFVPLHGAAGAVRGTIELTPLEAVPLRVEAHVAVAAPSCEAQTRLVERTDLTPKPKPAELARPKIFEARDTKRYLRSPDQIRLAVIAGDAFTLEAHSSGTELGRYQGINPVFSPTGRYLAFEALTKRNEQYNDFKFIDTVDGKIVATLAGHSVSWDQKDSYVLMDKFYLGDLRIFNAALGFHDCKINVQPYGFNPKSRAFRFDLDNNIVLTRSSKTGEGSVALPLTSCSKVDRQNLAYFNIPKFDAQISAVVRSFQMAPFRLPKDYETENGRRIFNLANWLHGNEDTASIFTPPSYTSKRPVEQATGERSANGSVSRLAAVSDHGLAARRRAVGPLVANDKANLDAVFDFIEAKSRVMWLRPEPTRKVFTPDQLRRDVVAIRSTVPSLATVIMEPRALKRMDTGAGDDLWPCGRYEEDTLFERPDRPADLFNDVIGHWKNETAGQHRLIWQTCALWGPEADEHYSNFYLIKGTKLARFGRVFDRSAFASLSLIDRKDAVKPSEAYVQWLDGDLLVVADSRHRLAEVIDAKRKRTLFKLARLSGTSPVQSMRIDAQRRWLLQIDTDGSFFVYALRTGAVHLLGRLVDDEIVVWDQRYNFDATEEGAPLVEVRFPGISGTHTFHQFEKVLRVPNLVQRVLAGETLPRVAVGLPPSLTAEFDSAAEPARITGRFRKGAFGTIAKVQIYQDGVLSDTITARASGSETPFDVARLPGTRWVSLLAVDANGLASQPVGRDLGPDPRGTTRIVSLAVGISDYLDDTVLKDLAGANYDAATIHETLRKLRPDSADTDHRGLVDSGATREAILREIAAAVAKAGAGDTLLFSFAGHGVRGQDGIYYLTAHDTRYADLAGTAIAWGEVSSMLRRSKARIVLLIDACHSGVAGTDFFAANDAATDELLAGVPANIIIFAAAKGREFSYATADGKNGEFTRAFVDVILGQRDAHDLNQNGVIEISELFVGVKRKVVIEGKPARDAEAKRANLEVVGTQTPWIARNQMVGDFALF